VLARRLPHAARRPKRAFLAPTAPSSELLGGHLAQRWLSMDATRRAGVFQPAALATVRHLVGSWGRRPSIAFYLSAYLTMALSAHLIIDMFCERFSDNLARRSPVSLAELRNLLRPDRRSPQAA
ncbi:MAG: hypothetical protein ACREEP_20450, partial [Dongiaceae bacterium]